MGEDGTVGTSGGKRAAGTRALSGDRRARQDDGFTPIMSRFLAAIFLGRIYLLQLLKMGFLLKCLEMHL